MAQPSRDTRIRLEEEAMAGSDIEARQEAARRRQAAANAMPSKKEIAAMPAKARAQLREAIAERTTQSAARLDILLTKAENDLVALEAEQALLEGDLIAKQAEAEAAAAAGAAAEAEGDKIITQGVISGTLPFQGLPSVFQTVVNQAPQFKTTSDAALTAAAAVLRAVGVEGLEDAMAQIRKLYPDITSEDALSLLKFDPRFNAPYLKRFAGNKLLMDAGFAPLDDKEYLATERAYDKIFTSYELGQFNNRDRFAKLIGSRISADELASRVSLAVDRVKNAARETGDAIRQLYPELTNQDLVAYAIDPVNQLPALQRKVQAAEIGGAALAQNLSIGLQAAPEMRTGFSNVRRTGLGVEELIAAGVDLEKARTGFSRVAEVLPTSEKLSAIYGGRLEQYGRTEAEQEQFKELASAKRARQRLTEAELAQFSGEAGYGRVRKSTGGMI